jgi:hypothetical protein
MMITTLKPAIRAGEHDFWHRFSSFFPLAAPVHDASLIHTKGTEARYAPPAGPQHRSLTNLARTCSRRAFLMHALFVHGPGWPEMPPPSKPASVEFLLTLGLAGPNCSILIYRRPSQERAFVA